MYDFLDVSLVWSLFEKAHLFTLPLYETARGYRNVAIALGTVRMLMVGGGLSEQGSESTRETGGLVQSHEKNSD